MLHKVWGRGGPQNPWSDRRESLLFASIVDLLFKYSHQYIVVSFIFFCLLLIIYVDLILMVRFCIVDNNCAASFFRPHDVIPDLLLPK